MSVTQTNEVPHWALVQEVGSLGFGVSGLRGFGSHTRTMQARPVVFRASRF